MKVTKSYLKQIIKEELNRMQEAPDDLDRYLATKKGREASDFLDYVYNKATDLADINNKQDMADLEEILKVIDRAASTMDNTLVLDLEGRNDLYDRVIEPYGY